MHKTELFAVRAGEFLTPFGVWNVDHGSPAIIPMHKPWVIGAGWIPERPTGLEIFGRRRIGVPAIVARKTEPQPAQPSVLPVQLSADGFVFVQVGEISEQPCAVAECEIVPLTLSVETRLPA